MPDIETTSFDFSELLPAGMHLCYIYSDDAEREQTMAAFFASGIARGQKGLSIVDTEHPHDVLTRMKDMGVTFAEDDRRFSTAPNDGAYCPHGAFSPDDMLNGAQALYEHARGEGFSGLSLSGDMSWAVRRKIGLDELLRYEVRVNEFLKACPVTAICEYDARKFDGKTIMDILNVHPAMLVGGHVVRNPYFVRPEDALDGGEHLRH